MKAFYNGLKEVYWPQKKRTSQLFDVDGVTILKQKNQTFNRFAQHFDQLLNVKGSVDPLALDSLPNLPQIDSMNESQMFEELQDAIMATREKRHLVDVVHQLRFRNIVVPS